MIRVAIVEDEAQEQLRLQQYLLQYSGEFVIRLFSSAVEFLAQYTPEYEIVFMDIDLPELDGMAAAARLRKLDREVCLIFVTNMARFAVKGYEVAAFDFIVKPVSYQSLVLKLGRVMEHLATLQQRAAIIRSGDNRYKVNICEIIYVEIQRHRILYHTLTETISSYGTLKSVEELLTDPLFVRCNNCYLVNLRFVTAIVGNDAIVHGERLQISAPRKAAFEQALVDYLCSVRT